MSWSVPGYDLLAEIARGGQGVVYRARHQASGHEVALKALLTADAKARARFQQEGRVLSLLDHPQLLRVFEVGAAQGSDYLVTELIGGGDLGHRLERQGPPPFPFTTRVVARIARCLQYCHEHGVVHRDLKPSNIVVDSATERPVLIDFGLVKRDPEALDVGSLDGLSQLSQSGSLKGTPAFMAPEQVRAERAGEVGPRTDVYGLGATLYMLLCGQAPFSGSSMVAILRKVSRKLPEHPRKVNPAVPAELARIAMDCLAKAPADRPRSAAAVALALESFLGSQAAPAPTPSRPRIRLPGRGPSLQPGARLGPYAVVGELGRGGMGVVYEGRGAQGQRVAIKTLLTRDPEAQAVQRFQREAQTLASLQHANVIGYAGAGAEPCPWIAMEFVQGSDLRQRWEQQWLRDPDEVARILAEAAEGLAHVHGRGLVHRDVKPDNILVRSGDEQVFLTDFGVVRDLSAARLTADGSIVGTLSYMSPEQVLAEEAGPPADVWGLGAVLYRGLCGENPFVAPNELALTGLICEGELTHPLEIDPRIPPDLAALSLACLQVDPELRPTAAELAAALRERKLSDSWSGFAEPPKRSDPRAALIALAGVAIALMIVAVALLLQREPPPSPPAPNVASVPSAAPAPTPRKAPLPEAPRDATLLRLKVPERIELLERWLREHPEHPENERLRRSYVSAKLARGPTVLPELGHGELRAYFHGDGFLISHRPPSKEEPNTTDLVVGHLSRDGALSAPDPVKQSHMIIAGFRRTDRRGAAIFGGWGRHQLQVIPGPAATPRLLTMKGLHKVRWFASSPDGRLLAAVGDKRTFLFRWDDLLAAKKRIPTPLSDEHGHERVIDLLAWASDGTLVTVSFEDASLARWSTANDRLERTSIEKTSPWPIMIAAHPTQPWIAEGLHVNRVLRLTEAGSGAVVSGLEAPTADAVHEREAETTWMHRGRAGHMSPIMGLVFSPSGDRLYSISGERGQVSELRVWATGDDPREHGEWIPALVRPPGQPRLWRVDLSPDGRTLLTISEVRANEFVIELWDVAETPN